MSSFLANSFISLIIVVIWSFIDVISSFSLRMSSFMSLMLFVDLLSFVSMFCSISSVLLFSSLYLSSSILILAVSSKNSFDGPAGAFACFGAGGGGISMFFHHNLYKLLMIKCIIILNLCDYALVNA